MCICVCIVANGSKAARTGERANERTGERANGAFVRSVVRLFGCSGSRDHKTTGRRDHGTTRPRDDEKTQAFSAILRRSQQYAITTLPSEIAWCQSGADTTLGEFGGDGLY